IVVLLHVGQAIVVRVGAGGAGPDPGVLRGTIGDRIGDLPAVPLLLVSQAVVVAVGFERIKAVTQLVPIIQAVTISVGFSRIGALGELGVIRDAVTISVRGQVVGIKRCG